jgi:hypothetical protein
MTEPESPLLVGAQFLGLENDIKFQRQVKTDPYLQAAVTALGQVLLREEVPEVEVTTSTGAPVHVEAPERPLERRRSGAKNVSDPKYQEAFISEARHSMGQPTLGDCQALIGQKVTVTFNAEHPSGMRGITGYLTNVVQPSHGPAYVMLDNDTKLMYPLNSIQSIEAR